MAETVDNRVRLTLKSPIEQQLKGPSGTTRTEYLTELVFKEEAEGSELMLIDPEKPKMEIVVAFGAAMCGQPVAVIKRLKGADFWAFVKVAGDFLQQSQPTEETSSVS